MWLGRDEPHSSSEASQTQPATSPGELAAYSRLEDLMDKHQYFEAFKLLPSAVLELRDVPEGMAPYLHDTTLGAVCHAGRNKWSAIFESTEVPLFLKLELVEEINLNFQSIDK